MGGLIGGLFEAGSQLYHSGKITSWKAVGGSALQGAVTGGVAGFTGGASLLATAGASAGANVIGGAANRLIQGKKITAGSVTTDAVTGALAGVGGKFLDKGIKVIGSRFTSSAASKAEAAVIKRELGNWVDESTTGWSKAAKEYQEQITGQPAGKAYLVKGTKFDGIAKDGTLLEAKSSYDNFVKKGTGQFYGWFKGAKSLVDQARRQLTDAAGKKIVWHIETKKTFDAIENLFEANGISGITLEYTPRVQ
ncbi:Tox-REase-5 domain-containing protein [Mucilaginibacter gracilis]|uniref:Tox-REase-5 domain-containing protein n=1 Tax=Mucilaginibacter gracilis TaxID=423350 RepID=UPI00374336C4